MMMDGRPLLLSHLGPDALDVPTTVAAAMERGFATSAQAVKSKLLDQRVVAGIGNIYSDEILFQSQLHPSTPANAIAPRLIGRLVEVTQSVLSRAVAAGGSSLKDKSFRDPTGRLGRFQETHVVYGRTGDPCRRCGSTIVRTIVGGRSAHFCPRCQTAHSHGERRSPR
jgi:formamidopyrimidine-DNA glycosylase